MKLQIRSLIQASSLVLALGWGSATALAEALTVDTQKSQITWLGKKKFVSSSHNGTLKLKEGQVDITKGQGSFVIDMNSIDNLDLKGDSKNKLLGHLRSDDFFSIETYPTAVFQIKSIKPKGKDQYDLIGDLTIKGKTNPMVVPATIAKNGKNTNISADVSFDRTKWDVSYNTENSKTMMEKLKQNLKAAQDSIIDDQITISVMVVAN